MAACRWLGCRDIPWLEYPEWGLCESHFALATADLDPCGALGCDTWPPTKYGMCTPCWQSDLEPDPDPCEIEDCSSFSTMGDDSPIQLCGFHKLQRFGIEYFS